MRRQTTLLMALLLVWFGGCASDPNPTPPCTGSDCEDSSDQLPEEEEACTPNVCGGCEVLSAAPGDACGTCGVQVCEEGSLLCNDGVANACGGCETLEGAPDDACGTCGTLSCDGKEALECVDVINSCGGCDSLEGVAGESCGQCAKGKWTCDGAEAIACIGDVVNACGGCATLPGIPERLCGTCSGGVWTCNGAEVLECIGANEKNACGGCALLTREIGEPCGVCLSGTLQCNPAGSALMCANESPCDPCSSTDANDTIAFATNLGMFSDRYDSNDYRSALHSVSDVDFLKLHVLDESFSALIVAGRLVADTKADLCIYFDRDDMRAPNISCVLGIPSTHEGRQGCCSSSPGGSIELKDNNSAAGRDDSGWVYYRISSALITSCHNYHLWFGL